MTVIIFITAETGTWAKVISFAGIKPEDKELWDMPVLYLLIFALMVAEWIVRRRGGLA